MEIDLLPGNNIAPLWYEDVFRSSEGIVHLQGRGDEVGRGVGGWSRLLPSRLRVRCGGHDAPPNRIAGDLCLGQSWAEKVQTEAGGICLEQVGHGRKRCRVLKGAVL